MLLHTSRLTLRPLSEADVPRLLPILSDARTMVFWPSPPDEAGVRAWVKISMDCQAQHGPCRFGLWRGSELLGDCGVVQITVNETPVWDLGYVLHHPYWGRGYATEAAQAVVQHAFDVWQLPALHCNMPHNHTASRCVAEKLGFTFVRTFQNARNRGIETTLLRLARPI